MWQLFTEPYHFPYYDPALVRIGPFAVHYYALAYILGLFLALYNVTYITKWQKDPISRTKIFASFNSVLLATIIGGRLGYVFFYQAGYYLSHPIEAFYIWQGGMSFHGGMIGCALGILYYCRKNKINYLCAMDVTAISVTIPLFLGRLSNYINGELWGRPTNGDWGVIFSRVDNVPRHPSQLYEAASEGILLYLILFLIIRFSKILHSPGLIAALFVAGYGIARFFVEFFREPDSHLGLLTQGLSRGQQLAMLQILFAIGLFVFMMRHYRSHSNVRAPEK
ncbi:MAG: prolipoprotein diacylglyceryl transferase [Alphaproteobacteria bacterium]|nr:prolipoprotein diacylglyceryl transferase [Alphaproteobacteria bacterium]